MAERHSPQQQHDYSADPKALTDFVDKGLWLHEAQQSTSADIWRYMNAEQSKQRQVASKSVEDKYFDGASLHFTTDADGKMTGTIEISPNEFDTTKVDAGDPETEAKIAEFKQAHQQLASEDTKTEYTDGTKLVQDRSTDRDGKLWSSTDFLYLQNNVAIMDNNMVRGGLPTKSLSYTDKDEQYESVEFRYRSKDALDRESLRSMPATPQHKLSIVSRGYLGEKPEIYSFDR